MLGMEINDESDSSCRCRALAKKAQGETRPGRERVKSCFDKYSVCGLCLTVKIYFAYLYAQVGATPLPLFY